MSSSEEYHANLLIFSSIVSKILSKPFFLFWITNRILRCNHHNYTAFCASVDDFQLKTTLDNLEVFKAKGVDLSSSLFWSIYQLPGSQYPPQIRLLILESLLLSSYHYSCFYSCFYSCLLKISFLFLIFLSKVSIRQNV